MRGGRGLGWSAGRVRVRSERVWGGCGQNFSNSCGCGAGLNFAGTGRERTQNFNPRRSLVDTSLCVSMVDKTCRYALLNWYNAKTKALSNPMPASCRK